MSMKKSNQAGFSMIELAIAIIILFITMISLARLSARTIVNGDEVANSNNVKLGVFLKANSLIASYQTIAAAIPAGGTSIGSIAPSQPVNGYFDYLNLRGYTLGQDISTQSPYYLDINGNKVYNAEASLYQPHYIRQWVCIKDTPLTGEYTFCVSVTHIATNQIVHTQQFVKIDGVTTTTGKTGTGH